MRRRIALVLSMLIALIQSSCSNKIELNSLAIINGIAYDLDESNQWELTFQIIIPKSSQSESGGGGSQSPVTVFTSKGKTLLDAIQRSELEAPRHLFFSHTRVIIISKRVAMAGLNPILDANLRSYESRENTNVLLSDGEAKKVLEVLTPLENIPGNAISNLIKGEGHRQSVLVQPELHELITRMATPSMSATLPEIKVMGERESQISIEALHETRSPVVLKLGRIGVFKQDKFAGWLNREEGQGIPWIMNDIKRTTIVFSCEGEKRREELSSFMVERSRTQLKPNLSMGKLTMSINIEANGSLIETTCNLDLKKSESLRKLEKHIEEQIKNKVETSFQAAIKMKADILGFGNEFHKFYPQAWKKLSKNWGNEFAEMRVEVKVKVKIQQTGMIDDSFSKISETKK